MAYPFKTATEAIVHAFNDERHGGARPTMAKLADKRLSDEPEFGGVDRGVEKASAEHLLSRSLSRLHLAVLRARFAPRHRPCQCCHQKVWREDWQAALREVAHAAGEAAGLPGHAELRLSLVRRHYEGNNVKLESLASKHGISESTVRRISSLLGPFLKGTKGGKDGAAALAGIDQAAFMQAEEILRAGGFIE